MKKILVLLLGMIVLNSCSRNQMVVSTGNKYQGGYVNYGYNDAYPYYRGPSPEVVYHK